MSRHRQLVAIMFTDIEGYTSTMQQDEEQAISFRAKHREVFNRLTTEYKGRILQYYGDGTLSVFDSALEAVKCAIELQTAYLDAPVIPVRIGIHTGDIIYDKEEIIGDGVNVASRIESLAVSGSVLISEKVYDEIKNHPSVQTQFLKTFELKNVHKPMEVYAISNKPLVVPNAETLKGKTKTEPAIAAEPVTSYQSKKRIPGKLLFAVISIALVLGCFLIYQSFFSESGKANVLDKSIAVLAFANLSEDPDQEYFSDGISEEILNSLAKVEGLNVAGRTSSFSFKDKDEDIKSIGKKLGVSMVLEGSVRKSENRVRITAQLINAADGYHIWSEQFDRELKDVFAIQEEIATNIVRRLELTVLHPNGSKPPTENLEAYDYYLKGIHAVSLDMDGVPDALNNLQKAIDLDPNFALAYAGLGESYINASAYGFMEVSKAMMEARKAAKKSIFLDDTQYYGHVILALVYLFYDWDWVAAKSEYETAVAHGLPDPDYFSIWYEATLTQDFEKAIANAKSIIKRDALSFEAHWYLGQCYYLARRFDEALNAYQAALDINPDYSEGYRGLGICYWQMGQYDQSIASLEKALELTQGRGPAYMNMLSVLGSAGQMEALRANIDKMHEAATLHTVPSIAFATGYAHLGDMDEAFKWLDQTFEERFLWLLSLRSAPDWDVFRADERFDEIVRKMNFPEPEN